MLLPLIAGCEAGFWVLLLAGLAARYLLGRRRLGAALLLTLPLLDVVLFAATVVDLRSGAAASEWDGLAALYLGFTVAFGHRTIRWADERFAHRFAGGPPPARRPRYGMERTRYEWGFWLWMLLGGAVSCALLLLGVALVGDLEQAEVLFTWMVRVGVILAIALIWPVTYTIWPAQPKRGG
ncbi:MAG: hypothetical protein J2P40_05400 [Candidatus Dormibacteraeota bacterium]|nr:hypothetical protein [Candidatus Dormibacteraeota bacterium]MBO0760694.1 hypothetical protein [Candidatus Dormibacteraeota bacterium]